MKTLYRSLCFLFICVTVSSCGADNPNGKLIVGNWQGAEWLINNQPSERNVNETSFLFDDKGNYTFNYGITKGDRHIQSRE